jgi:hypothetical protein
MDFFNWLENELNLVVGPIKKLLESPEIQVFKWLLAAVAVYYVIRLLLPTWRIIALSLYEDLPWSLSRSLLDLIKLNPLTLNREKWYRAARVRVEWELLQPRPDPPPRHHALPRREGNRLETRRAAQERYAKEQADYHAELARWKTELKTHLANLSSSDGDIVVEVDDVSKIYARADEIRNYFGVLATDKSVQRYGIDRFVSKVRVRRGFIAPLHLLSGLLAETEEDWGPVIEDYGRQVAQAMPSLSTNGGDPMPFGAREAELRLQRLQTFLFDCWLLWGPSIPLCTCEAWHGGRRVLQFGFGDENNSLALLFNQTPSVEDLRRFFSSERVLGDAPAIKVTGVTGVLQWGPSVDPAEVSLAQQSLADPDEDRLALLIDESPLVAAGNVEEGAARYYSAYLWVMFAMCDDAGTPLYRNEPWRGVLPFFEHANIAEGQAMALLKRQLVVKTLSSVLRLLRELPHLTLQFVCAIDESGCGCELLCPPPQGEALSTLIHKVIEKDDMFAELRPRGRLHGRLRMAPVVVDESGVVTDVWQEGNYSACHLPDLVESYYDYLQNIANGGTTDATASDDNSLQAPLRRAVPTEA